jgi:hypothetical protein
VNRLGESAYIATCGPCGKRTFATRKKAQKTAKQIPGRGLHAYKCPTNEGWHLGHLPDAVVRGIVPKSVFEDSVDRKRGAR